MKQTLPKAQRTRGLSSAYQSNFFITSSYTNLDQTSSESRPSTNLKVSTKYQQNVNLKILTKIGLHNLNQHAPHHQHEQQ